MNLFILSLIQKEIAQFMMDKHVSKILLEAVQMLCTAKRVLVPDDKINDRLDELEKLDKIDKLHKLDSLIETEKKIKQEKNQKVDIQDSI